MIMLEIIKPLKFKPVKWLEKIGSNLNEPRNVIGMAGNHPHNPEHGSAEVSVKLKLGDFEGIKNINFLGDGTEQAKMISWRKGFWGNYLIEIEFNTVYLNGFQYSTQAIFGKGESVIGFTEKEIESMGELSGQRDLLSLLSKNLLPIRQKQILEFARPGFICIPNEEHDARRSHFVGAPKHKIEVERGENGTEKLFHLATINTVEFGDVLGEFGLDNFLSFYLKITDSENGWPEAKGEFKVVQSSDLNPEEQGSRIQYELASNFDLKPLLDIPAYDDSILIHLSFSDEERASYEALRSIYMQILLGDLYDMDVNKFMGYPESVQYCVGYEAERIKNKRDYDDSIHQDAIEWVLLLQVSPYCKWYNFFDEFGDGTIYFMIRKNDLKNSNFSECQIVVQNT